MWCRRSLSCATVALVLIAGLAPASAGVLGIVGVSSSGPCTDSAPVASGLGDPFGYLEGHGFTGGNVATGVFQLVGWALDNDGVAAVDILLDGRDVGRAAYGVRRSDVAKVFPGFPDSALPGFSFQLDTTHWPNGLHELSAVVVSRRGEEATLNRLVFDFQNNSHNLKPFGRIDYPQGNTEVFGVCGPSPERRYTVVEGWALDVGVETNDHGVGYVELLIDGAIYANNRLDCVHSTVTGQYTNCYGVSRADIEASFPSLIDSPDSGFRFVVDVGALISGLGYTEGRHIFTIRVGDVDSQVANIDTVNVNFTCQDVARNQGSFGAIDEVPEQRTGGSLTLTGWALDAEQVAAVKIFIDGRLQPNAAYGFPRPNVTSRYPGFPDSLAPGWAYTFDTRAFAAGVHFLTAVVVDRLGDETQIGQILFKSGN